MAREGIGPVAPGLTGWRGHPSRPKHSKSRIGLSAALAAIERFRLGLIRAERSMEALCLRLCGFYALRQLAPERYDGGDDV